MIARRAREEARRLIREAMPIIEICEIVENLIRGEGAEPAFPCNIGVNEVAAHYTSPPGDKSTIPPRSIVKVDLGVSLDGYLADTATSVALAPELEPLSEAAGIVLREAIRVMRAGTPVSKIGSTVQEAAGRMGFKPIRNLTGHEIKRYQLHAGVTIPNVRAFCPGRLEPEHVYAVEPFLTTMKGAGEVVPMKLRTIFQADSSKLKSRRLKQEEKTFLQYLVDRFDNLPYTARWIENYERLRLLHERLVKRGKIYSYPVLVERFGEPISQSEHTVIVLEEGCEIIT